ncbi:methyltransferase [Oricola sp.]|uniref:methyltransferase n=1 Tax=Oricola sp. TaxID=1979950 RepID=UPI0025FB0D92|nr:methyltransferase [Oricola sp.]MCI5078215.1 methyltransferase domain-containing protein [Oricola sp.]
MTAANQSSGDLTADRRAEFARHYAKAGDFEAAADLIGQALDLAPDHLPFLALKGDWLTKAGRAADAAEVWRAMLRLDAADRFGAQLKLASLGLTETPDAPPAAYVESLFDDFAPTFDRSLVQRLDYHAPQQVAAAVFAALGPDAQAIRHAVDLGCGTGLMGEHLRSRTSFLEGLDLSAGMLRRAAAKKIYDRLEKGDVAVPAPDSEPGRADLAVAADVYIYLGDLAPAMRTAARLLQPGGLYAFTVEAHDGPEDYALRSSLRYAHGAAYLRRALAETGFDVLTLKRVFLRMDGTARIEGHLVVARKADAAIALTTLSPALDAPVADMPNRIDLDLRDEDIEP